MSLSQIFGWLINVYKITMELQKRHSHYLWRILENPVFNHCKESVSKEGQKRKYQLAGCKNVQLFTQLAKIADRKQHKKQTFGSSTQLQRRRWLWFCCFVLSFLSLINVTIIISKGFPLKRTLNHKFMALIWKRIRHLETWESYHCKNKDLLFWPLQLCWCWH